MSASSLPPENISIPKDILSLPQEEPIQLTIAAIQNSSFKPNGDPYYSAHQAAKHFYVSRSSLGDRLRGMEYIILYSVFFRNTEYSPGRETCDEVHVNEHLLTDAQEEILAHWVKVQGRHGIPLT
jgi:hypothetical protein